MRPLQVELCIYQDGKGRQPFADWFDSLADRGLQENAWKTQKSSTAGDPAVECSARPFL